MSNRKKARMDAIERRLASLEGTHGKPEPGLFGYDLPNRVGSTDARVDAIDRRLAAIEAGESDPPEFSCRPEYEPDDDRVMRASREYDSHPEAQERQARKPQFFVLPDDVRERARERASLADDLARTADPLGFRARAERFEASLRALQAMVTENSCAGLVDAADLYALIEGCLAGGTITPEGLRDG